MKALIIHVGNKYSRAIKSIEYINPDLVYFIYNAGYDSYIEKITNESNVTFETRSKIIDNFQSIGEAFWGYLVADCETEKIIKWGHDCLRVYNKESDIRRIKDWIFRKDDEIPKDYKWSNGEYEGWLQYRWGDGLNAIKYGENAIIEGNRRQENVCVRHCNVKKKKYNTKPYNEVEEFELDKLNEEILAEANS